MHASILLLLFITALATARTAGTYGWTSIGCYIDSENRLLSPVWVSDNNNNIEDCLVRCRGYKYAMTEDARECWCGNTINNGRVTQMSDCNMACPGDKTQKCGGFWRGEIYEKGAKAWCLGGAGQQSPAALQFTQQE